MIINDTVDYQSLAGKIEGVSFIDCPQDNTVLYVGKKLENRLHKLDQTRNCVVMLEEGMLLDDAIAESNTVIYSKHLLADYGLLSKILYDRENEQLSTAEYQMVNGATISTSAEIGDNVLIESGAFIDHKVIIGAGTRIRGGARIHHACIGEYCDIGEYTVIGAPSFTNTLDADGNRVPIYALSEVTIGDHVHISEFTRVNRGQSRSTTIGEYAKIDGHVAIGHDSVVGRNAVIAGSAILAGFVTIADNAYVGIGALLKPFVSVGENTTIGIGAVVVRSQPDNALAVGNPAKTLKKR
ncbi:MAG: hypothetical protein LBS17_01235 [Actinomycetes bacterium]|jgi:UDP-3-O-[3-hydroxymyristoyl] glucosamine N-acyltransferase LpxD|nr:hypothetical protein [Actinomycetes bacterium]